MHATYSFLANVPCDNIIYIVENLDVGWETADARGKSSAASRSA